MTYILFIDDERFPTNEASIIARSSSHAIEIVKRLGIPKHIDFDHDLGGEDTTRVFVKFFEEYLFENNLKLPENFTFGVHSQNPIGKTWIIGMMNDIKKIYT